MTETSDDELRKRFYGLSCISHDYREALEWAQRQLQYQEQIANGPVAMINSRDQLVLELRMQLRDRNETIDKLEAEIERLTDLAAHKPTNLESDEERHQRHRRERMRDEVTLICVRDGIERIDSGSTAQKMWGRLSRDTADSICYGIEEYDAEQ